MFEGKRVSRSNSVNGPTHRRTRVGRRLRPRGLLRFEPLERREMLATYLVDLAVDENDGNLTAGDLSLREAILAANVNAGPDVIEFSSGLAGQTITMAFSEIPINDHLTINGLGANQLAVSGNNLRRIFNVNLGVSVVISGLTLRNGKSDPGAAVRVLGSLSLNETILTANVADGGTGGGALYVALGGSLTITNSTLSGNRTTGAGSSGGAIYNAGGTVEITGSTISSNTAVNQGGGVWSSLNSLTITNSTLAGNSAAIGGGLYMQSGGLTLTNSTVSGNSATGNGGGLFFTADALLTNATITNNRADSDGNGSGTGGGINRSSGTVSLTNTIVAGNFRGNGTISDNVAGTIAASSSITSGDPLLGPLASNGGPTQTHALLPGSPAIDSGTATRAPATDQRGVARPQDGNSDGVAAVDIGAFELEQENRPPVARAGGPYVLDLGSDLTLDARGSFDPDVAFGDSIALYEWDLGLNGTFEISTSDPISMVSAAMLQSFGIGVGEHIVGLRVTDSHGEESTDTASLTIYDNRPFASLVASPSSVEPLQPVTFDASGSTHGRPDREIVRYDFDFGDGATYSESAAFAPDGAFDGVAVHAYSSTGDFAVTVTVTDDNTVAKSDTASATVTVSQINHAPVANAGGPYSFVEGATFTLNGSGSDPDGDAVAFHWDLDYDDETFDADVMGTQPQLTYADDLALRTIALRVTDSFGLSTIATTTLEVTNAPPSIQNLQLVDPASGSLVTSVAEGKAVQVRGVVNDLGALDVLTLRINWGDMITDELTLAPGESFQKDHTYVDAPATPLNLTIALLVTDDDNGSSTRTVPIQVTNASPTIESLEYLPLMPVEGGKIDLTGIASDPAGAFDTLAYSWMITGPNGFSLSPTGPATSFTPTDNGTYSVKLTVNDGEGGQDTETKSISVANANPTANFLAVAAVDEGNPVLVSFSNQSDASNVDAAAGFKYSYDFDGDTLFELSLVANDSQLIPASYFADGPNERTVRARITDKDGGFSDYSQKVTIRNVAPTITGAMAPAMANEGDKVTFSASATDPAGALDPLVFTWEVTKPDSSKNTVNGATAEYTLGNDGIYVVTLVVSDGDVGGSTSWPTPFSIDVQDVPPQDLMILGPTNPRAGEEVTYTATAFDPGGDTLEFSWDVKLNDAPISGGPGTNITFTVPDRSVVRPPGEYVLTVAVIAEADGALASKSVSFLINPPPIANAGGPYTVAEGATLVLDGSATIDDEPIPGSAFHWDLDYDGMTFDVDKTGVQPIVTFPDAFAARTIALRVTDADGEMSIGTTTLRVINAPPTAHDQTVAAVEDEAKTITLTGSDPTNDPLVFVITSLPAEGTLFDGTTEITAAPFTLAGDAVVYLGHLNFNGADSFAFTVQEELGEMQPDLTPALVAVNVAPVNDPPVIAAPSFVTTATEDLPYTSEITATDVDTSASELVFTATLPSWLTLIDHGDGTATLEGTPTNEFVGQVSIAVTVSDGAASTTETFEITVANTNDPPRADAGGPYEIDLGMDLLLDAGGSFDPDAPFGDIVSYEWDLNLDGTFDIKTTMPTISVSWSTLVDLGLGVREHTIGLLVTDDLGEEGTDTAMLTIRDDRPVAVLNVSPTTSLCGDLVLFDASGSRHGDPNRAIVRFEWDFGDGTSYAETAADAPDGLFDGLTTHTYSRIGTFSVRVTVIDDNSPARTASADAVVIVTIDNTPPIANAGGPYTLDLGASALVLDGSGSSDVDVMCGDVLRFAWDIDNDSEFDDGDMAIVSLDQDRLQAFGFDAAGAYPVRLRVTDSFGEMAIGSTMVHVYQNRPMPVIGIAPATPLAGQPVTFDGSGSSIDNPARSIVTYEWDFDYDGVTSTWTATRRSPGILMASLATLRRRCG